LESGFAPVIISIIGGVLLFVIIFVVVFRLTAGLTNAGRAFLNALKDGDSPSAYEMLTEELKFKIGSLSAFQKMLIDSGIDPASWFLNKRKIGFSGKGLLTGFVTMKTGVRMRLILNLNKINGEWRIDTFRFLIK